jgi:DNA polymerase-3 subunit beta
MKFRVRKPALSAALAIAKDVADRKSTMDMLKMTRLLVRGQTLHITATDLNVSVTAEVPVLDAADGGIAIEAKALHDVVASLPGDELTLEREENNWATVKAKRVRNRLVGQSDRLFSKTPSIADAALAEVSASTLREMLDRTLYSVCNDETRFQLNGVLFESDGAKARMVSTDGHRLSRVDRALAGPQLSSGVIIPRKGLGEIRRLIGDAETVGLAVRPPYVFVRVDGVTLAVKLVDAQFPPYEQVFPRRTSRHATVERSALLDAARRGQLIARGNTAGIRLSFGPGGVKLSSNHPDLGDSEEEIEAAVTGDPIVVGVNPKYLVELLGAMAADQVTVELDGELDPVVFRPFAGDDYVGLIMPCRI